MIYQILKIIFLWGERRRLPMSAHLDTNPVMHAASQNCTHVLSIPMLFNPLNTELNPICQ